MFFSKKIIFIFAVFLSLSSLGQKGRKATPAPAPAPTLEVLATQARLQGFEQSKALDKASWLNNIPFRNIGPTVMSGRVVDIEVNPSNAAEFLVAYASGGLWLTKNNGISFDPLFDNEAVMTIGDIAVDWKTGGKHIWVGTGESNSSRSSYAGVGIYKTTDGGQNWQYIGLPESHHIGRILLHPTNPNTAWVAAVGHLYTPNKERGMYKTTDGGKTWQQTLFVDENTGAIWAEIDPSNPDILYACLWYRTRRAWNFEEGGASTGIYKSTDGGTTWQLLTGPGSGFPQGAGNGRVGVAVAASNPQVVYAVLDNQAHRSESTDQVDANKLTSKKLRSLNKEAFLQLEDGSLSEYLEEKGFPEKYSAKSLKELVKADKIKVMDVVLYTENANDDLFDTPIVGAEVYRSNDGGKTWQKANKDYMDWVYNTYGYYFGNIWVAANNPDKIAITGYQVIRSEDGGKTYRGMNADNVHADHHTLWINPQNNQHMILGNDGGVNITYDNGKTWFKANTPAVGQFYAINVDMAKPYQVYGGLQDNGVWYGPSTYQASYEWYDNGVYPYKFLLGGDGMQVGIDTRDNQVVYTGFQFGNYFRINKQTGERKYLSIPREIGEPNLRWNWQSPIWVSRHNQDVVYFGSNRLHRSLDKGETWKTLSGDLTLGGKPGDVPFGTLTTIDESPRQFGKLYVGSDDGLVHLSGDGGYTWSNLSNGLPQDLWVSRVVASAHADGRVYVSLNGYRNDDFAAYLYRSNNDGKTWEKIGKDLPAEPINVVKEDPKNPQIVYVGTDRSLFVSLNGGASFMRMSNGLPAVPIHDLVVHSRENELVLGTHGRSLFVADVSLIQQLGDSLSNKNIHLFALKGIQSNRNWGQHRNKYEDAPKYEYTIPFFVKNTGKTTLQLKTDKGLVLQTWTDDSEAGINFAKWDYSLDPKVQSDYEKYLNDSKKKDDKAVTLTLSDDKKLYIRPGKYKLSLSTEAGSTEREIEVKAPSRRGGRSAVPSMSASPGEWEEWMEENDLEKR
jgi:photosystem II stability/assembly factor-like uncharacterized protein